MSKLQSLIQKKRFVFPILLVVVLIGIYLTAAQNYQNAKEHGAFPLFSAKILNVRTISENPKMGNSYEVTFAFTSDKNAEDTKTILHKTTNQPIFDIYPKVGDKILVLQTQDGHYAIADYERVPGAAYICLAFVILLFLFGIKTGVKSLLVLAISLYLIVKALVPLILLHHNSIIFYTILISSIITIITQFVINGFNAKSYGVIIGTIGGILISSAIAVIAINMVSLTGFENDCSSMLKIRYLKDVDFRDILFCGIILGALGAVMDVSISIASAQYEIKQITPKIKFVNLFKSGMNIGKDVIGTMTNTLVLAYIGSSLPLILLLSSQSQSQLSMANIMNSNMIVTEIVRSLIGGIGLLSAIPATALATAFLLQKRNNSTTSLQTKCNISEE
jgi:uncharacterized membrane protein